jgi:cell division septal protein FtsQ
MHEIDTAEHIQQMRRTRRLCALSACTIVAAVVGVVAWFMVSPDPPPRPQMQTAVEASSTRTVSEPMIEVAPPAAAPTQATERTKSKLKIQPSADHDRSRRLY